MRIALILAAGLFLAINARSQNAIPNPGFENWQEESVLFTNYEDPVGWGTSNGTTASFGIITTTREEQPAFVYSGNSALRLETEYLSFLDLPIQGGVATAELEIDLLNQSVTPIGGVPFNLRPSTLSGWYQYMPSATDSARVGMLLRRWNAETGVRDTIAYALFETVDETEGYTLFEAPFIYQSDLDPDTMLLGILCSKVVEPSVGSILYMDELSLSYPVTGIPDNETSELLLYPNPNKGAFTVHADFTGVLFVMDLRGAIIHGERIDSALQRIELLQIPAGVYSVVMQSSSGNSIQRTKLMVVR